MYRCHHGIECVNVIVSIPIEQGEEIRSIGIYGIENQIMRTLVDENFACDSARIVIADTSILDPLDRDGFISALRTQCIRVFLLGETVKIPVELRGIAGDRA